MKRYNPYLLESICAPVLVGIILLPPLVSMIFTAACGSQASLPDSTSSFWGARQLQLFSDTVSMSVASVFFSLCMGVPLSVIVEKTDIPLKNLLRRLYLLPAFIPPVIHGWVWMQAGAWLKQHAGIGLEGPWGCAFIMALCYFPFITLLTVTGLKAIDRNVEEAGLLEHGVGTVLSRITLPLVIPHILSGAILVFLMSALTFSVPDMLRVKVYAVEIFVQYSAFFNEQAALLLSVPLVVLLFTLVILQSRLLQGRSYVQTGAGDANQMILPLKKAKIPAFLFCALIFALALFLPIAVLVEETGNFSSFFAAVTGSLSQTVYSLKVALSGAALAVAVSIISAIFVERSSGILPAIIHHLSFLPLAIPATALGLALLKAWNMSIFHSFLDYSSGLLVLGYGVRFLPFAFAVLLSCMRQIPRNVEEAAMSCFRRHSVVLFRILLPLLAPAMFTAFLFVFVMSFSELGMTLLIMPAGRETLVLKIYNFMHYGAHDQVAALSLFMVLIICIILGAGWLLKTVWKVNPLSGGTERVA